MMDAANKNQETSSLETGAENPGPISKESIQSAAEQPARVASNILAIVVDIAVNADSNSVLHLWIQDSSLPPDVQACISIRGFQKVKACRGWLGIGDVIYAQGILHQNTIGSKNRVQQFDDQRVHNFIHESWKNPSAQREILRLGHMELDGTLLKDDNDYKIWVTSLAVEPNRSTHTNVGILQETLEWYRKSTFFQKRAASHLSNTALQTRSLIQLQDSLGLRGHVIAKVTQVRTLLAHDMSSMINDSRFVREQHKRQRTVAPIHALLCDDEGTMMIFVDPQGRFHCKLKTASCSSKFMKFSNVETIRMPKELSLDKPSLLGDDLVVLAPMVDTQIESVIQEPKRIERVLTNGLSMTQHSTTNADHDCTASSQLAVPGSNRVVLMASVDSLQFADCFVHERLDLKCFWKATLISSKTAHIILRIVDGGTVSVDEAQVCAGSNVLRKLAGDFDVFGDDFDEDNLNAVKSLLCCLIKEQIRLEWKLESIDTTYHVVDVSLPFL